MFDLHLTPEQVAIRRMVRDFTNQEIKPIALERDRLESFDERFPWEVVDKASQMGLRTLALSEKLGGGGADTLTCCIVTEEMAVGDVGLSATLNQTSTFGHIWFDGAFNADHPDAYADGSLPELPLQTMTKVFTSETVQRVCLLATQLFGGMGVMREFPMQKYYRDAVVFLHGEHTNDVARLRIAELVVGFQRAAVAAARS